MDRYDVIVIGGGPAGSTLSALVAKAGHKVLLLEKEKFPRYQIGESLLPATIQGVCALLGVADEIHKAGFVKKLGGTFRWGRNQEPWTFSFGEARVNQALQFNYAYQVERARFDEILLANAGRQGVEVVEGATVTEPVQEDGRVTGVRWTDGTGGEREAAARYVVDAAGHQSRLYRQVGERVFSKFFQNVALFCYFEGGARLPAPNSGNIFSCAFDEGWFWYIPLSDELTSVGVVVAKDHVEQLQAGPDQAMRGFIEKCPPIRDMLGDARRVEEGMYGQYRVRKDYSYCNSRFWAPGLLLAGDSACFVDPIFSSGVHLATYAGLLGARSINTCLGNGLEEEESLGEFERRYRREFGVFYDFLLAFYDMHQDEESYFWSARKVLRSEESANDSFLQLVAGAGTTASDFWQLRSGSGELFQLYVEGSEDPSALGKLQRKLMEVGPGAAQVAVQAASAPADTAREMIALAHFGIVDDSRAEALKVSEDGLRWQRA